MTPTPDTTLPEPPTSRVQLKAAATATIGFILTVFAAGLCVGVIYGASEKGGLTIKASLVLGLAAAGLVLALYLTCRGLRALSLPRSPRMRRSRLALYLSLAGGTLLGIVAGMTAAIQGDHNVIRVLLHDTPLPAAVALTLIAGWLLTMALSAYWHATLDEFERAEYDCGASIGMYAFALLGPTWWIAARANLLPPVNGPILFLAVCFAWTIGWLFRRFR